MLLYQLYHRNILYETLLFKNPCLYDKDIFIKIREITISLISLKISHELIPPYVILWILDWCIEEYPHHKKNQLIQRIYDFKNTTFCRFRGIEKN